MRVFDNKGTDIAEVNVSEYLGIDDKSKPVTGFYEPLITLSFKSKSNEILVSVYHRFARDLHSFVFDFVTGEFSHRDTLHIGNCSTLNFPIKTFFSEFTENYTTFFRQGHCVTRDGKVEQETRVEKITEADLGSMYLLFEKSLITRSSSSILFFKLSEETGHWEEYHRIDKMRGQIYFIRGNIRFQVVTDENIYFFLVCPKTLMPNLENVMRNFMNCSMMMIGKFVRFAITYKTSQPGFTIYRRQMYHNFKVAINSSNYEGSHGINIPKLKRYAIGHKMTIEIFDQEDFKLIQTIEVPNPENDPELCILYMTIGRAQNRIGVSIGRHGLRNEEHIQKIVVFKRREADNLFEFNVEQPFTFHESCPQFQFSFKVTDELLFFDQNGMFAYDYVHGHVSQPDLYTFHKPMNEIPKLAALSNLQDKLIVASKDDVYYIDMEKNKEYDLDELEKVAEIESVASDQNYFYCVSNKRDEKLGLFLFMIDIENPDKPAEYLLHWQNKLNIGNVDVAFMREHAKDG